MALITDLPASTTLATSDLLIKDTGSATQKITAANALNSIFKYVDKTFTNITIATNGYATLGSVPGDFSPMGATDYMVSAFIRGWTGGSGAYSISAGSNGGTLYIMGPPSSTLSSVTVRLWYMNRG